MRLVSYIPLRILYVMSGGLYFLAYYIVRYRRKVVRRNLVESFPEKNAAEIKRIEKDFYKFFVDNFLETCKMRYMSAEEMSRHMVFTNIEEVNEVLRKGRSVGIYLGHLGNWEWISSMPIHLEKSAVAAQIYHRLSNKTVDRWMLENRASHGAVNVEMRSTARYITSLVNNHQECIVGFIADQSPRRAEIRHYVEFLNHNTPVTDGTEKIIRHYNFDAWFLQQRRVRRGYYEATFIRMTDDPAALPHFRLTEIYYQLLEKAIRRQPEMYLWSHRRFKHATPVSNKQ